jgi:citrate synthase
MDDADRNTWAQPAIPADSGDQKAEGFLSVKDSRTGAKYAFPIYRNAVHALSFRQITAGDSQNASQHSKEGLRVFDPGFRNTAVKESNITYTCGVPAPNNSLSCLTDLSNLFLQQRKKWLTMLPRPHN